MYFLLKAAGVAIYASGLAGLVGFLPTKLSWAMQFTAATLLTLHVLEVVFKFKYVRLYRGPLTVSIVLTLFFGVAHWRPLVDQQGSGSPEK